MQNTENRMSGEVDKKQSSLMAVIAHQIRSPLATIRLSNQTLLLNEDGNLNERQIHLLKQADERAARIFELSEELLKADVHTSEQRPLNLQEGYLEDLIEELLQETDVAIQAKDLQVVRTFSEQVKPVLFDRSLLSDVITNLLDNAISYTPEGGTISIATKYEDEGMTVSISDTGPGIPNTEAERLFEKFSRFENGVENRRDGLGLGLYVAKMAIEQHGGKIWFESNIPHGSSFTFRLPVSS